MSACPCGYDFRNTPAQLADPDALVVARRAHLLFGNSIETLPRNDQDPADIYLLDDLSLDGLFRITWATGLKKSAAELITIGSTKKALTISQAEQYASRSASRLRDFLLTDHHKELRTAFFSSTLLQMMEDGLTDADRFLAAQLLTHGKRWQNSQASLLHQNPLAQMKLF